MENAYDVAGNHLGGEAKVADLIWVETHGRSWWPAQVINEHNVSGNKPLKRSSGEVPVRLYGSYKYLYVDPHKCRSDFEIILEQNNGSYREIFLKALEQDTSCMKSCISKKQGFKSKGGNVTVDASRHLANANRAVEDPKTEDSNLVRIRSSPRLQKQGKKVEDKNLLSRRDGQANSKDSEQGGEEAKRKSSGDARLQKKLRQNGSSAGKANGKPIKQDGLLKNAKANGSSVRAEVLTEAGARRLRVMQNLGLIAPPGSPFHKIGHV